MKGLVLSLFPGIGLLDMAFEEVGFCIVRGPDLLWGGDIRRFPPPAGRFDGVIGRLPCHACSRLRHIVETNGYETAPDLIPEYERVTAAAGPTWFWMENVPKPIPEHSPLASGGSRPVPVAIGGSGKKKRSARSALRNYGYKTADAFRNHCRLQGLPDDFDLPPFTVAAKVKAVGNGVPLAMGRAVAQSVARAIAA